MRAEGFSIRQEDQDRGKEQGQVWQTYISKKIKVLSNSEMVRSCKVTRGNFDRWGTLTPFSFQHFPLNVTGSSNYHLGS